MKYNLQKWSKVEAKEKAKQVNPFFWGGFSNMSSLSNMNQSNPSSTGPSNAAATRGGGGVNTQQQAPAQGMGGSAFNAVPFVSMFKGIGEGVQGMVAPVNSQGYSESGDLGVGIGGAFNPRQETTLGMQELTSGKADENTVMRFLAPPVSAIGTNAKIKEAAIREENKQKLALKQRLLLESPISKGGMAGTSYNPIDLIKDERPETRQTMFAAYGGYITPELIAKSGIYIKPENKGKFTATKERTGKTTEELTHSKNPLTRKRAIFAQNAAKWNHADGGYINQEGNPTDPPEQGLGTVSSLYTPSDKTQWVPQSAALSKYKQLVSEGKTKEAENVIFGYYSNEPYGPYEYGTHTEYEKKGKIKSMRAKDLLGLDTKKYKAPKDYAALMETLRPKLIDRNPGQQYQNVTIKAKGGYVNPFSSDVTSLIKYKGGGTHAQNPLGGIPIGMAKGGNQNTVENNETSFNFKEGKYVFSNRLKVK